MYTHMTTNTWCCMTCLMTCSTTAARDSTIEQQQETWLGEMWNTACGISTHTASVTAVDGTVLTRKNRSTRRKSRPSVTSSTTNLTCTDLGSKPRLCCGGPVTDRLSQSTAEILTEKCNQNYGFIEYKEHAVMVTKCVIQDCFGDRVSVRARYLLCWNCRTGTFCNWWQLFFCPLEVLISTFIGVWQWTYGQ